MKFKQFFIMNENRKYSNATLWKYRKWFNDKGIIGEYMLVDAMNSVEFVHRLKWLSEGSLAYHITRFQSPLTDSVIQTEKNLHQAFLDFISLK